MQWLIFSQECNTIIFVAPIKKSCNQMMIHCLMQRCHWEISPGGKVKNYCCSGMSHCHKYKSGCHEKGNVPTITNLLVNPNIWNYFWRITSTMWLESHCRFIWCELRRTPAYPARAIHKSHPPSPTTLYFKCLLFKNPHCFAICSLWTVSFVPLQIHWKNTF